MGSERTPGKPTTRRYSQAEKDQAVRLVRQLQAETGKRHGAIQRVAAQLGYGVESVRTWVKRAEVDAGEAPGATSEDAARIKALEQEVRELRRANAILKSASSFFAAELDRPQR
jgi:transposase-like protein